MCACCALPSKRSWSRAVSRTCPFWVVAERPHLNNTPDSPPPDPNPPSLATHLGRLLADVVQHPRHRRLQRLVGVAAGCQLNQSLAVLLDEVATLAVAAGRMEQGRAGRNQTMARRGGQR